MNSNLVIAMMCLLGVVCVLFVFAMVFGKQPPKSTSQATVKPQAPTEEELLLAMSDSELLRKIAKHSEESAFVLKRFLSVVQVFAVIWFGGMIIQFIQAAN